MSTSFHFTTPMPGSKATTAPMKATAVWLMPCCLSVAQRMSTTTKMATDFHSSVRILPSLLSSSRKRSIPPAICGTRSSFFRGKKIFVPTNQAMRMRNTLMGNATLNQSW